MKTNTQELVTEFIADCRDRGLSPGTLRRYSAHLKHFVLSFPDGLPWEWDKIEWFLNRVIRKKDARPEVKKSLQALYKYLGSKDYGKSPIPPGKVGRPRKMLPKSDGLPEDKLGRGGQTTLLESNSTSIFTKQAVEDFVNSRKDLSPESIRWYLGHLFPFIQEFTELPITPEPVEKHIFALKTSAEYRHGRFRALRALYHFLELRHRLPVDAWGVVNPIRQIKSPKVPRKLPDSLDISELQALINACQTPQDQALIALLADNGVRAGEIVSITRENIGDDYLKVIGKTGERDVSVSPQLRDILLALVPAGPVFLNCWGKPFNEDGIYFKIRQLLTRAGIKKRHMGPHLLRHTFGRQSVAAGADLVTVQKQMGHKNIGTTRIYTELSATEVHKRHQETSPLKQLTLNFHEDDKP